jgi:hypothetical protein
MLQEYSIDAEGHVLTSCSDSGSNIKYTLEKKYYKDTVNGVTRTSFTSLNWHSHMHLAALLIHKK